MSKSLQAEQLALLAQRVWSYCESLAAITQTPGQVDRRYLTQEHAQANNQVSQWAAAYGLQSWQDQAGNQWARLASANPDAKRLIIGSHLDTVPNGGKYDGILGVVLPLVILQELALSGYQSDVHLDVVGFGDEEGTRFGTTLLGSSAAAGKWREEWFALEDPQGCALQDAFTQFGLDPKAVDGARIATDNAVGYVEIHIEQGPVLESDDLPIGIVSGISGAKRFRITLKGNAGHAGTVPMNTRHDPLVAAARWADKVDTLAREACQQGEPVVATVGQLQAFPGAVNVIPGSVEMSLDVRSLSDEKRDALVEQLLETLESSATEHKLRLEIEQIHNAAAVNCNARLIGLLSTAANETVQQAPQLPSGAGHDAMVFADTIPTGMLFMRCRGGISHHPDESVTLEDIKAGIQVMHRFLTQELHQL